MESGIGRVRMEESITRTFIAMDPRSMLVEEESSWVAKRSKRLASGRRERRVGARMVGHLRKIFLVSKYMN